MNIPLIDSLKKDFEVLEARCERISRSLVEDDIQGSIYWCDMARQWLDVIEKKIMSPTEPKDYQKRIKVF